MSEPISDESRWPPELILLREKFTAKSQLEIAQLQIKHEEEVSIEAITIYLFTQFLVQFTIRLLASIQTDVAPEKRSSKAVGSENQTQYRL